MDVAEQSAASLHKLHKHCKYNLGSVLSIPFDGWQIQWGTMCTFACIPPSMALTDGLVRLGTTLLKHKDSKLG